MDWACMSAPIRAWHGFLLLLGPFSSLGRFFSSLVLSQAGRSPKGLCELAVPVARVAGLTASDSLLQCRQTAESFVWPCSASSIRPQPRHFNWGVMVSSYGVAVLSVFPSVRFVRIQSHLPRLGRLLTPTTSHSLTGDCGMYGLVRQIMFF